MKIVNYVMLIVLVVMSGFVTSTLAQDDDDNIIPTPVNINTAQVQLENDLIVLAVTGELPSGCEFPIVVTQLFDSTGTILYVEIWEQTDASAICPFILLPYEASIPLGVDPNAFPQQVLVNGVEALISPLISIQAAVQSVDFPPAKSYHEILDISVEALVEDDQVIIMIDVVGQQNDQCEFEIMTDVSYQESVFSIEIYREMPLNVRCIGGIIGYQDSFEFVLDEDTFDPVNTLFAIDVNDMSVLVQGSLSDDDDASITFTTSPAQRNPLFVETTIPENFDEGVGLRITGSYPSGCEYPVRINQTIQQAINRVRIELYEIAYDETTIVPCPTIQRMFDFEVPLDEVLNDGSYIYNVNDARGDMIVRNNQIAESVMIIVDTVIDSVAVEIAESSPPQLILTLIGYQSDGCTTTVNIDSDINTETNVITVHVYRNIPQGVMCTAAIVDYEETVNIGQVQSGVYTLIVNEVETEVDVQ